MSFWKRPDAQKAVNREKSKIRAKIEHIFGFIKNSMKGSFLKYIGLKRNKAAGGMINLVYNLCRYEQLIRLKLVKVASQA